MASGETTIYDLPYPLPTDSVDVAGDIQSLAEKIELVLSAISPLNSTLEVTNNSGSAINKGDPVYISGYDAISGKPEVSKSQANNLATFPVVGLAELSMSDGDDGVVVLGGIFENVNTSSYSAGDLLYVGSTGGLTTTQPLSGSSVVAIVAKANASGVLIVGSFKGNGTWGALKAGL